MGHRTQIIGLVVCVIVWSWIGYFNISIALERGESLFGILIAPNAVFALALVPIFLSQICKLLVAERKENVLNPHFLLTASQSRLARIFSGVIAATLLVSGIASLNGYSMLHDHPTPLYLSVLYIAFGLLVTATTLLSPRMRLRLTQDGLEYSRMRPAMVSWENITDVKVRKTFATSWIVVTLRNTTEFSSANWLTGWRKVEKVKIYPHAFGIDAGVLKEGIEARRSVFTF